jgi:hypothetical protein
MIMPAQAKIVYHEKQRSEYGVRSFRTSISRKITIFMRSFHQKSIILFPDGNPVRKKKEA